MNTVMGIRAHLGWAATATIRLAGRRGRQVTVLRVDDIETGDDRQTREPYHVAGGFDGLTRVPPPRDQEAAVRTGLRRQLDVTRRSVENLLSDLEGDDIDLECAVILTGRGKLASTLGRILASHAQIHIAEGIAVRESIATAFRERGVEVHELDEKSLDDVASVKLGLHEADAFRDLTEARSEGVSPWRKEQKLCALAAWVGV